MRTKYGPREAEEIKKMRQAGATWADVGAKYNVTARTMTLNARHLAERLGLPEGHFATRRRWTEKEDRRICELVGRGKSDKQIAKALGRSEGAITVRRARLGFHRKRGNRPDTETLAGLFSRLERGETLVSVARDLGVPHTTLRSWLMSLPEWENRANKYHHMCIDERTASEVLRMLSESHCVRQIANVLGLPYQPLLRWTHRHAKNHRGGAR